MNQISSILTKIATFKADDLISGSDPILIYGAGGYGRELALALKQQNRVVLGFIDSNQIDAVMGLPCRRLDSNLEDWLKINPIVLIGLHNHYVNPVPIRNAVQARGFTKVYIPVEYHCSVEKILGHRYWLGSQHLYQHHLGKIEDLYHLLEDDQSRSLLIANLEYRALARPEAHPPGHPASAYFPPDLPEWSKNLSMVDGGAFTGDSLATIPLGTYDVGHVYAFEPDLNNFSILQTSIQSFRKNSPAARVSAWPCGLGNENKLLKFNVGLGPASVAGTEGNSSCPIVRLDDVLHNHPVNLIKLDIEGAEPDALRGADRIIREQHPGLAICIYHAPDHLWTIPLGLARKYPRYRYFIRSHGQNGFDLVLYAIPA